MIRFENVTKTYEGQRRAALKNVDVEIAKWFARYAFGREQRLSFVCAPTALREALSRQFGETLRLAQVG